MRAWRLLTTKPSPFVSVRARAKLWLPPVSSNGLNRTSPTRWIARRRVRFEDRRPRRQLVELAGDREDLVEVGVEDRLEAAALRSAGDAVEAPPKAGLAAGLHGDDDEEEQDGDDEADDDRAEIRGDESVQIDRTVLRQASDRVARRRAESSIRRSARTPLEPGPAADAILRGSHRSISGGIPKHMAKRSRVGGRPGQRRPMQRTPARPAAARPTRRARRAR